MRGTAEDIRLVDPGLLLAEDGGVGQVFWQENICLHNNMCRRLFVKVDPVEVLLCGQNDGPVLGVPLTHLIGNTVMNVDFHCCGLELAYLTIFLRYLFKFFLVALRLRRWPLVFFERRLLPPSDSITS